MLKNYPDVLSAKEVCQLLRISAHTLYKLIQEGELPDRKIGGKYKITKNNLTKFLEM